MSIYKEFKVPLIDFIDRANEIPNLIGVVLYGSAITADISKKSDIDLLLITKSKHNPEIGEEANVAHKITSEISKKHNLKYPFSLTFYNMRQEEEIETDFLWEICKDGIVLWSNPKFILSKNIKDILSAKLICIYSFKGLEEKNKRAIIRKLYKSKSKLINENEEKLAPGVLLIDSKKESKLIELFDKYGVKNYKIKKIWTH